MKTLDFLHFSIAVIQGLLTWEINDRTLVSIDFGKSKMISVSFHVYDNAGSASPVSSGCPNFGIVGAPPFRAYKEVKAKYYLNLFIIVPRDTL